MEWQPIDTAPKDGSQILVTDGRYCRIASWAEEIDVFDWVLDLLVRRPAWVLFECDDPFYTLALVEDEEDSPTHWMPLPSLPE